MNMHQSAAHEQAEWERIKREEAEKAEAEFNRPLEEPVMPRTRRTPRMPRKKVVKVQYVPRPAKRQKPPDPLEPYGYLDDLVAAHHDGLAKARIAIAWMLDVKADRDGHLCLGRCRKATDLDREFREFDVVVLLNAAAWKELEPNQRRALVDHELCHATVGTDKNGEEIRDERDRLCYRMRKHDIEEFNGVVKRHGLYLSDLAEFVRQLQSGPLFAQQTRDETDGNGKPKK